MRLLLLHPVILLLAALTTLTSASSAKCQRWKDGFPITKNLFIPLYRRYSIEVSHMQEGEEDVPALCDTLWKELKQFKGSCVVSVDKPTCKANGPTALQWIFSVGLGCNKGMVHAAWWDSTKNRLGRIDCDDI